MSKINQPIIYGIEKNNKIYYIGKTIKYSRDKNNILNIKKYSISTIYTNQKLNDFKKLKNISIKPIRIIKHNQNWFDEKIIEIVNKHKQNHPLKNARWMIEGKKGPCYWIGKKKDQYTIQKLSESKYKKIVQYDQNGNFIKIWNSTKEVAIKIFKDYKIVNGSAESKIYNVINNKTINKHFSHDNYWFKYDDILKNFNNQIPKKLNLNNVRKKEAEIRSKINRNRKNIKKQQYTIIHYNPDGKTIKKIYDNSKHAAYELNKTIKFITNNCKKKYKYQNKHYILRYGEKKIQPINIKYPNYKITPPEIDMDIIKLKEKNKYKYIKTKTWSKILSLSINDHNVLIIKNEYKNIHEISKSLLLTKNQIYYLTKKYNYLKKYLNHELPENISRKLINTKNENIILKGEKIKYQIN
ncbi:MAG: hypothetical protein ACOC3V_00190 [bacterium]